MIARAQNHCEAKTTRIEQWQIHDLQAWQICRHWTRDIQSLASNAQELWGPLLISLTYQYFPQLHIQILLCDLMLQNVV